MDIYKHKLKIAIAASLVNCTTASSEGMEVMQTHDERRLCDCTNCRMGKSNKCSTFNPKKSGKGK